MSGVKQKNWEKPIGMRAWELSQALLIVRDALQAIERGELHHIVTIAGQLRSMLCERRREDSLLFSVANTFNIKLQVWALPQSETPPFFDGRGHMLILGGPFSCFRFQQNQRLVDVEKLLEETVVFTDTDFKLSFHSLIKFYADKMGGAHYDPSVSLDVAKMLQIGRMTGMQIASPLLNLAAIILEIGGEILGRAFDFRIDLSASLPIAIQDDKVTLFHGVMPTTRTEFELFINSAGAVSFFGKAMDNRFAQLCGGGPKNLEEAFWITVKHRVSRTLKSQITILVNGKSVDEVEIDVFAISGDMPSYKRVFGGNVDSECNRKSPLCLGGIWISAQYPPDADIEMNRYLSERGTTCTVLKPNSVFRFEKGDNTGKAEGSCIFLKDYHTAPSHLD